MMDVNFLAHHLIIVGGTISASMDVTACKQPPLVLIFI